MKVICINDKWVSSDEATETDSPVFGEECFVTNCRYDKEERRDTGKYIDVCLEGIWYQLRGYFNWFHSSNFATLPDVQEQELVNEKLQTP